MYFKLNRCQVIRIKAVFLVCRKWLQDEMGAQEVVYLQKCLKSYKQFIRLILTRKRAILSGYF